MRILYLGSPDFAVKPLEALIQAGHTIVSVITQPDRPAGRKKILTPPPVKQAAERYTIPVLQPVTLRDPDVVERIAALSPDVGVVAAYGEILRKAVLAIPPLGYLNIHPSLLPLYRGPSPVAGAILSGDTETGVTIMKLERQMDSGPILAQVTITLPPTARTGPLTQELFQLGAELLVDVLPAYTAGYIEPHPQDHSQATLTRLLKKTDGMIKWEQPALVIERLTRAYDPWPGAYTIWQGQYIKIRTAKVHTHANIAYQPGTIIGTHDGPLVATGNDALEIQELQPAGKRSMSGQEWLHGQRDVVGHVFGV